MWQELSSLPLYEHYRHSLDPFFAEVLASRPWSSHLDIRHAWKLTVPAVRHDVTKEPVL
ncbi:MAG: putative amidoligase domain-containing protein [Clostridia bacterium]